MAQLPAEQQARPSLLEPYPRAPTLTLSLNLTLTLITDPNPDPYPDPKQARLTLLCGDAHDLTEEMRQADVVFAYSSAFASQGDLLTDFSYSCGTRLRA